MFKRYVALITDQGLDAAIPLVDDPEVLDKAKKKASKKYQKELHQIYLEYADNIFDAIFEKNRNVSINNDFITGTEFAGNSYRPDSESLNGRIQAAKDKIQEKVIEAGRESGAVDPMSYKMFSLRKLYAGQILLEPIFSIDEEDFEKIRSHMSPWHAAFHILDGMITGKTDLSRFSSKGEKIAMTNNMKDVDVKKLKKIRRLFFDKINRIGEDDPDEI